MMRATWTMIIDRNRSDIPFLRSLWVRRRSGWQREGDDEVAARRAERAVAAGADDEILTLVRSRPVGHGRGLTARGQLVLPQLASGLDVKGTQVAVHGRCDKHQVAVGRNRSAHVRHAEIV